MKAPRDVVRDASRSSARIARELVRELVPTVLFFFGAFLLIFLIFKLFVAQYSIEYSAFTRAAIAALILGKVVPLLEWANGRYAFGRPRRITSILVRTLAYALVVIALGSTERVVTAFHHERSWSVAIDQVLANADIHHFLGLVLLLALVVGAYLTIQEIDRAVGPGALGRFLLERPSEAELSGANEPRAAE